ALARHAAAALDAARRHRCGHDVRRAVCCADPGRAGRAEPTDRRDGPYGIGGSGVVLGTGGAGRDWPGAAGEPRRHRGGVTVTAPSQLSAHGGTRIDLPGAYGPIAALRGAAPPGNRPAAT